MDDIAAGEKREYLIALAEEAAALSRQCRNLAAEAHFLAAAAALAHQQRQISLALPVAPDHRDVG